MPATAILEGEDDGVGEAAVADRRGRHERVCVKHAIRSRGLFGAAAMSVLPPPV
jgi:hypothetical protein